MLHLTDLMPAPGRSLSANADAYLPKPALELLDRVAPTGLPVLCTGCFGAAFVRLATAIHLRSEREHLVVVDLRRTAGTLPAGLPSGARAARTTLALDGLEHLDRGGQEELARQLALAPSRLLSAVDVPLDSLRQTWRPDLFALISTVTVATPALARLGEAIAAVARRRLTVLAAALGAEAPELASDAIAALAAHAWPGDLPELDAVLVRTLLASPAARITAKELRWDPAAETATLDGSSADDARTAAGPDEEVRTAAPNGAAGPPAAVGLHGASLDVERDVPSPPEPEVATPPATASSPEREEQPLVVPTPGLFRSKGAEAAPPATAFASTEADVAAAPPSPTLEALAVELAHQLKNPLVTIKTFVSSIESLYDDPHELGQFRALTDEAVTRMDDILDGLLAFARLGTPVLERLDVLALLRDALRTAWRALSSKQVTLDAPDDAKLVASADREHVRFALGTLARHVAETIEARGTLVLAIEDGPSLRLAYRESGAVTHLRGAANVDDSGLPLALLLVRGALARVGGGVDVAVEGNLVTIRLRLSPP